MATIQQFATDINAKAHRYQMAQFQAIRKSLKGFRRRPGNAIFSGKTIFDGYAYHNGGRKELQFNIGFDGTNGVLLRHGVAFSFETGQALPDIGVLRPKVRLFNDFLELYPSQFAEMRMWHWDGPVRSADYSPSAIPDERIKNHIFVFLGYRQAAETAEIDRILHDFDSFLPLYKYVESNGVAQPILEIEPSPFQFRAGCSSKKRSTTATGSGDPIDVDLRHNAMQQKLYDLLVGELGQENVGTELMTGNGTRVDVVAQRERRYWFYEIKTFHSGRACIRDAIGQLLEYSHWPNGTAAEKFVVVGENPLDSDGEQYIETLRARYSLPIDYLQVALAEPGS